MDQVVPFFFAHVRPVMRVACSLNRAARARLKFFEIFFVVKVAEPKPPVIKQDSGSGMHAFENEHALASQAIVKRLELVDGLEREVVIGERKRKLFHRARQFDQRSDIHMHADIEKRIIVVLEEMKDRTPMPILYV
jgi:hypothetical protein